MLSDAAFTSPWSSEVFITGGSLMPMFDDDNADLDLSEFSFKESDSRDTLSSLSYITTGSECSNDDLFVDGEDDLFLRQPAIIDAMETSIESDLSISIDNADLVDNWACSDFLPGPIINTAVSVSRVDDIPIPNIPEASTQAFTCTTISASHSSQSQRLNHLTNKRWSQLSRQEKLKLVEELSATISCDLGLREQLDVIKIINPLTNINNIDKEFVIDLESITDVKLQQIQNIVHLHCQQHADDSDPGRGTHPRDKKFSKKNKSQDRRPSGKVPRQRVQKDIRQRLKERRSGLFVKEERLAVSTVNIEEEIDVLG